MANNYDQYYTNEADQGSGVTPTVDSDGFGARDTARGGAKGNPKKQPGRPRTNSRSYLESGAVSKESEGEQNFVQRCLTQLQRFHVPEETDNRLEVTQIVTLDGKIIRVPTDPQVLLQKALGLDDQPKEAITALEWLTKQELKLAARGFRKDLLTNSGEKITKSSIQDYLAQEDWIKAHYGQVDDLVGQGFFEAINVDEIPCMHLPPPPVTEADVEKIEAMNVSIQKSYFEAGIPWKELTATMRKLDLKRRSSTVQMVLSRVNCYTMALTITHLPAVLFEYFPHDIRISVPQWADMNYWEFKREVMNYWRDDISYSAEQDFDRLVQMNLTDLAGNFGPEPTDPSQYPQWTRLIYDRWQSEGAKSVVDENYLLNMRAITILEAMMSRIKDPGLLGLKEWLQKAKQRDNLSLGIQSPDWDARKESAILVEEVGSKILALGKIIQEECERQGNKIVKIEDLPQAGIVPQAAVEHNVPQAEFAAVERNVPQAQFATMEHSTPQTEFAAVEHNTPQADFTAVEHNARQAGTDFAPVEPTIAVKTTIAGKPTIAVKPTIAGKPTIAVDPIIAVKPTITGKPTIARKPTTAVEPTISRKPTTAVEPKAIANKVSSPVVSLGEHSLSRPNKRRLEDRLEDQPRQNSNKKPKRKPYEVLRDNDFNLYSSDSDRAHRIATFYYTSRGCRELDGKKWREFERVNLSEVVKRILAIETDPARYGLWKTLKPVYPDHIEDAIEAFEAKGS